MDEPLFGALQWLTNDSIGPFGLVKEEKCYEEELDKTDHVSGCCGL
ncbi:hypothetical protein [Mesorhizobium sp. M0500]